MIKLNKILFPTDFSRCANQALSRALQMASHYNAELHMLHAVVLHEDDPYHPVHHVQSLEALQEEIKKSALEEMNSVLKSYATDGLKVVKAQERGISVAPVILEYADDNDIDLIVMGTHGRRGLGHLLLGSVAEEVVRQAPCPVLTVREQKDPKPMEKIQRILVPIDFSEHSKVALKNAKELATAYGAKLQLLHIVEQAIHPSFYATGMTSIFDFMPEIIKKSEEALDDMMKEADGTKPDYEKYVVEGRAANDIVRLAKENDSQLIVISTHGLTGLQHLLIGSVAEKVVRMASVPVLTLKAFGKSLVKA